MPSAFDFECGTCGKAFPAGWRARDNHCQATGHSAPQFECDTCPKWFHSQQACNQHMDDTEHCPFKCSLCPWSYPTRQQCVEHEHDCHFFCAECQRMFQRFNDLKMHLNSGVHRGDQVGCPFCGRSYVTATGLVHHLEMGSCPVARGLSRDEIYRFVRSKDPDGLVTKKLIGWAGSYEYEADSRTWNGDAYECYLCHRQFRQLSGLRQHLSSPTHQQALYHCPNCRMEFKSLAGIINHLESEACGCTRFEVVQRKIGDFVTGNRLISL